MAAALTKLNGPVISAGQAQSAVLALGSDFIVGLVMPEKWDGAVVSVIVSAEGDNYYDLFDAAGREFLFNVAPNTIVALNPHTLMMARYLILRSGTRKAPVLQSETRRFTCIGIASISTNV